MATDVAAAPVVAAVAAAAAAGEDGVANAASGVQVAWLTLSFWNAGLEAEYLGSVARSRWPVLMFIMTFDVVCYLFRIVAKCTTLYWRLGSGLPSSLFIVLRDMGPQFAGMIVLYSLIGLVNSRSKRLGSMAARQEELLLSVCMACAICSLLASLNSENTSDYVYAAFFLICTSTFLKIRWWVGTGVMATPVAVAKLWHHDSSPVMLPSDAMVHIIVAWAVGGLMAYLAEWYRRQMFASQRLAEAAHQKELLEAQARIKAQRQLAAAQAQAAHRALSVAREKASNEAKSEFMSLMCHEVRTPLNGCLASAEMLLETPLTIEQHELAKTICVSGSILLSTVSNFLDFFKLEAGKALDVVRAEVNLQNLVSDVHCIIDAMIGRGGQVCLLDPQMDGIPEHVVCDPDRVRGILLNLYTNAAKFTKQGHIGLRVREVARGHVPVPQEEGYAVVTAAPAVAHQQRGLASALAWHTQPQQAHALMQGSGQAAAGALQQLQPVARGVAADGTRPSAGTTVGKAENVENVAGAASTGSHASALTESGDGVGTSAGCDAIIQMPESMVPATNLQHQHSSLASQSAPSPALAPPEAPTSQPGLSTSSSGLGGGVAAAAEDHPCQPHRHTDNLFPPIHTLPIQSLQSLMDTGVLGGQAPRGPPPGHPAGDGQADARRSDAVASASCQQGSSPSSAMPAGDAVNGSRAGAGRTGMVAALRHWTAPLARLLGRLGAVIKGGNHGSGPAGNSYAGRRTELGGLSPTAVNRPPHSTSAIGSGTSPSKWSITASSLSQPAAPARDSRSLELPSLSISPPAISHLNSSRVTPGNTDSEEDVRMNARAAQRFACPGPSPLVTMSGLGPPAGKQASVKRVPSRAPSRRRLGRRVAGRRASRDMVHPGSHEGAVQRALAKAAQLQRYGGAEGYNLPGTMSNSDSGSCTPRASTHVAADAGFHGGVHGALQPTGASEGAAGVGSGGCTDDDSRWLLFEVMDTGVGITPEGLKSLFKEYVQGTEDEMKKPRSKGGTGLGLSICSKQVGVLGGRIGAYSCLGRGSVFWFTMPLITLAPTADQSAAASKPHAGSSSNQAVLTGTDAGADAGNASMASAASRQAQADADAQLGVAGQGQESGAVEEATGTARSLPAWTADAPGTSKRAEPGTWDSSSPPGLAPSCQAPDTVGQVQGAGLRPTLALQADSRASNYSRASGAGSSPLCDSRVGHCHGGGIVGGKGTSSSELGASALADSQAPTGDARSPAVPGLCTAAAPPSPALAAVVEHPSVGCTLQQTSSESAQGGELAAVKRPDAGPRQAADASGSKATEPANAGGVPLCACASTVESFAAGATAGGPAGVYRNSDTAVEQQAQRCCRDGAQRCSPCQSVASSFHRHQAAEPARPSSAAGINISAAANSQSSSTGPGPPSTSGRLLLSPGAPNPNACSLFDALSVKGLRALLVEDNLINQMVARKMLNSLGMQCEVASNGMEAVNAIQAAINRQQQQPQLQEGGSSSCNDQRDSGGGGPDGSCVASGSCSAASARGMPYDVVLMDMSMPVMGGVDATRAIRQLGCQVPIVAMTANASDKDRDECHAAGMNGFLSKPVLKERLAEAIMQALARAAATPLLGKEAL